MKNVLYLILAIILVSIVWGILKSLVFGLLGMAFHIAMIALFCYLVYLVYKAMTDKQRI
jgi:Na+(H+)/acetate symporter ActP